MLQFIATRELSDGNGRVSLNFEGTIVIQEGRPFGIMAVPGESFLQEADLEIIRDMLREARASGWEPPPPGSIVPQAASGREEGVLVDPGNAGPLAGRVRLSRDGGKTWQTAVAAATSLSASAKAAIDELAQKSLLDIQRETSVTWAWRAWAANANAYHQGPGSRERIQWLEDAEEYEHEAIEHASLAVLSGGEPSDVVDGVRAILRTAEPPPQRGLDALRELVEKSLRTIQAETARKWAWRAWAAYDYASKASTPNARIRWLVDAGQYAHEAVEHAGLSLGPGTSGEAFMAEILGIIRGA